MKFLLSLVAFLGLLTANGDDGKKLYEANCMACHHKTKMVVGPTLFEINQLHKGSPQNLVQWAKKPGRKRTQLLAMPSMAHVGDENLLLIAKHMLKIGSTVTAKSVRNQNPFKEKQGRIQRTFMPNSGVISFAIRLSDKLHLCWDAEKTASRYMWRGTLDPKTQFTSNGKTLPKVEGEIFYKFNGKPFINVSSKVKFLGYDITDQGLPEFFYKRGDYSFSETLSFKDQQMSWIYKVSGPNELQYRLPKIPGYKITASTGSIKDGVLTLSPQEMAHFTINFKEEK